MSINYIKTKLLFEVHPGKFLSVGFGDVANSESDIVCVSSSVGGKLKRSSAIGSIAKHANKDFFQHWDQCNARPGSSCLIDVADLGFRFKKLLVIFFRYPKYGNSNNVVTDIQMGLQDALSKVKSLSMGSNCQSIDITALGTRYGGVHRRQSFDLILDWAMNLFSQNKKIGHVRLVAFDVDTFIDYYEALFRIKNWTNVQLIINEPIDFSKYEPFNTDIATAVNILDSNPKQAMVACRTIIEKIVAQVYRHHFNKPPPKLVDSIRHLNNAKYVPRYIYSYLETCRVLGNFSAHNIDFQPTRRDAEGVMVLTLRVVEWYLNLQ